MEDFIERMRQLEIDRAQEIKSSEQDKHHLQEELAVTREQLRLMQEDVINTRSDLDREKEARRELEAYAKGVEHELDKCQTKLQDVRDAHRTEVIRYVEAAELLRLRSADVESLKVEAEATQFRCSQVTFLSSALRERVTDLEAEVKTLKCTQRRSGTTPASTDSDLICPGDTGLRSSDCRGFIR
jgi:chromosome segregation ATPase